MRLFATLPAASLLAALLLSGCHVNSHNNGKGDNVDIGTPFGSMQVKTNGNAATPGLTPYPGAQLVKDSDGDNSSADVNMSFGGFHLGVKAVSYLTPDSEDKVIAFYRKDMARYGAVLQCNGDQPVGQPTHTAEGLTCSDKDKRHGTFHWNSDKDGATELRAGSQTHQHIVAFEKKDGGTKIGLVALDLPAGLGKGDDSKDSD